MAAQDNPNVISAIFTELAARDNVDVVRGQLLPQVSHSLAMCQCFLPGLQYDSQLVSQTFRLTVLQVVTGRQTVFQHSL